MAKAKVSNDFMKFQSKNASALSDAKKAENTMQTCSMPIGWSGKVICVDAVADKGKDSKDDKGNTREGNPYVRLEFQVINDEEYAGQKGSLAWSFYDTEKATSFDRYTWMLNAMENMGLPGEVRRDDETTIEDLLQHFLDSDVVYTMSVEHTKYRRDNKELKVVLMDTVDDSDSVTPPGGESTASTGEAGDMVKYMGKEWELVSKDGEDLVIKSLKNGNERTIKTSDLD